MRRRQRRSPAADGNGRRSATGAAAAGRRKSVCRTGFPWSRPDLVLCAPQRAEYRYFMPVRKRVVVLKISAKPAAAAKGKGAGPRPGPVAALPARRKATPKPPDPAIVAEIFKRFRAADPEPRG